MKALTLHQPWAQLVALGVKTIETRSWSTSHRGPLAIHASRRQPGFGTLGHNAEWWHGRSAWDKSKWVLCYEDDELCQCEIPVQWQGDIPLPLGAVVATCTLVDVVPIVGVTPVPHAPHVYVRDQSAWLWRTPNTPGDASGQRPYGDFRCGRYAWLLTDVRPLKHPVPMRGRQGLWTPPYGCLEAVS